MLSHQIFNLILYDFEPIVRNFSKMVLVLVCLNTSIILANSSHSAQNPQTTKAYLTLTPTLKPEISIRGSLEIKFHNFRHEVCVYLPLNARAENKSYLELNSLKLLNQNLAHYTPLKGEIELRPSNNHRMEEIQKNLWKITRKTPGDFRIQFRTHFEQQNTPNEVLFDQFHPEIVDECQNPEKRTALHYYVRTPKISGKLLIGRTGTMGSRNEEWNIVTPRVSFGYLTGFRKFQTFIDKTPIEIFYQSRSFLKVIPTLVSSFEIQSDWLGAFPYPKLTVIESRSLHRLDIPGIITLNKARQSLFQSLQTKYLNWNHWAVINLLAAQWLGSAIKPDKPKDFWLIKGMTDFITLKTLQKHSKRWNLFNSYEFGISNFYLDYLQTQDLAASLLRQQTPNIRLTNLEYQTEVPLSSQPKLFYIRHAVALRFLSHELGDSRMKELCKAFVQANLFKSVSPTTFANSIRSQIQFNNHPKSILYLNEWWQKADWPDYRLDKVSFDEISNKQWLIKIQASQLSLLNLPVEAVIIDESGYKKRTKLLPQITNKRQLVAEVISNSPPKQILIDPDHKSYDSNRFNNLYGWPKILFFPGSANSISDDGYTVFWLPYPFRRPGEGFSLGLNTSLFRYLNSATSAKFELESNTSKMGYSITHQGKHPSLRLETLYSLDKNFDGHRNLLAQISRFYLPKNKLTLGVNLRERRIIGKKSTSHGTAAAFSILLVPLGEPCSLNLRAESERTLPPLTKKFSYHRHSASTLR